MTDVSIDRENVERLADMLDASFSNRLGIKVNSVEASTLRALLDAKEAAEAERDRLQRDIDDVNAYVQFVRNKAREILGIPALKKEDGNG